MSEDCEYTDPPIALEDLVRRAEERFRAVFGRPPQWLSASPGRVNLIGEHTDYNDGFVLPMAIDRHVVLAADRPAVSSEPGEIRLRSGALDTEATITADGSSTPGSPPWTSYVRGVVAGLRGRGFIAGPLDILIETSLPLGGGLSSSAALEVATATLIEAVDGRRVLDPVEKARLCQQAEQQAAGVPCGIMDQFSTVFGRSGSALLLDCRSLEIEWVPLCDPSVTVLVVNSGVRHALADGAYAERRAQCEAVARLLGVPALRDTTVAALEEARVARALDPLLYRRARHVVTENDRAVRAATAIRATDWHEAGHLMNASHSSLRDDYEVSCPELDWLAERASALPGVLGARMTGGGFGGCIVSLVRSDDAPGAARTIAAEYRARWGIEPATFPVRPAAGAAVVAVPG
jgi:galactokinase